jgi:DNA helicase-4
LGPVPHRFGRDIGSWNEPAQANAYRDGRRGILTANGEIVRSEEERMIADWLFYHGVHYQYERPYEHDTAAGIIGSIARTFSTRD